MRLDTTNKRFGYAIWAASASLFTLTSAQSSAAGGATTTSAPSLSRTVPLVTASQSSSTGQAVAASSLSAAESVTTLTVYPSQLTAQTTYVPTTTTNTGSSSVVAASTSVPSPTAALNSTVNEGILPRQQYLCAGGANATYCPGELLQLVQLSGIFGDSKTFPDKPTKYSLNETYFAFSQLVQGKQGNVTVGDVVQFVEGYFQGEGLELVPAQIENFTASPAFLDDVDDVVYKGFASVVHGYWTLLIR